MKNVKGSFNFPFKHSVVKISGIKICQWGKYKASIIRHLKRGGLSYIYTCHSVRASAITTLFQAAASPQCGIIAITQNKNIISLSHYVEDLSTDQKRDCCQILSTALGMGNKVCTTISIIHELKLRILKIFFF